MKRGIELRELHRENQLLKARVLSGRLNRPEAFADIITVSPSMRAIFQYVEAVAASPRPFLITGETGVGKELVARAVHVLSGRRGNFVPVNVAGLDDHVFADTLFGHKKGAFTNALEARAGLLEQAAAGTLFLDEIGDLSAVSQVKLLRLLQDGEYLPLGSDIAKRSDARAVVATNQDLESARNAGRFRKDLYYRLCGHRVHIPPLRERREDLPVLLDHFLDEAARSQGKRRPTPPEELHKLLAAYHFPGNVRELESMVFNAVSLHSAGKLSMDAFKSEIFRRQPDLAGEAPAAEPAAPGRVAFHETLPTLRQIEVALVDGGAAPLRRQPGDCRHDARDHAPGAQQAPEQAGRRRVTPAPMTNGTGRLTLEEIFSSALRPAGHIPPCQVTLRVTTAGRHPDSPASPGTRPARRHSEGGCPAGMSEKEPVTCRLPVQVLKS